MQRNWDCMKLILQALAEREDETRMIGWGEIVALGRASPKPSLANLTEDEVLEHLRLLAEAGVIQGHPPSQPMLAKRLTWAGHDLLETLASKGLWPRVQAVAKEKGIGLTLDSIGWLAQYVASQLLS